MNRMMIVPAFAMFLGASLYPTGSVVAQDGMVGFPVPVEVYKRCMASGGCYVVTEEELVEVLKAGYAEGYGQCRKESRI